MELRNWERGLVCEDAMAELVTMSCLVAFPWWLYLGETLQRIRCRGGEAAMGPAYRRRSSRTRTGRVGAAYRSVKYRERGRM